MALFLQNFYSSKIKSTHEYIRSKKIGVPLFADLLRPVITFCSPIVPLPHCSTVPENVRITNGLSRNLAVSAWFVPSIARQPLRKDDAL
jgi:hypothetical protein